MDIANFQFSPTEYSVLRGTRITWTNRDTVPHTVTSAEAPVAFDSGTMTNGQTFSYTFDTPGTYNYTCSLHSLIMRGKIIVQP